MTGVETSGERIGQPASRARLLAAMAVAITDRGYRDTTVADVVARARTSRRTFYESFDSKEDCFVALVEDRNLRMRRQIVGAIDQGAPWDEQVRAGVLAWIAAIAAEPALGISLIRDVATLGDRATVIRRDALRAMTGMLVAATAAPGMRRDGVEPVSVDTATVLLGGLRELVVTALEQRRDVTSIAEAAVGAALALLGPASSPDQRSQTRPTL